MPLLKVNAVSPVHPWNALLLTLVTLLGNTSAPVHELQLWKALSPIDVMFVPSVTLVTAEHP